MRKIVCMFCAAVLLSALCMTGVFAESYVNLDERFGDIPHIEFEGSTYYMNDRLTGTLVMIADLEGSPSAETGLGTPVFIAFLVLDDDAKLNHVFQIDANTLASWREDECGEQSISESFSRQTDVKAGCTLVMEILNDLFPHPVIDDYVLLDAAGLPVLDGMENTEENTSGDGLIERLRSINADMQGKESGDYEQLISDLGPYTHTELKSGPMMKIIDKVERYERKKRVELPVLDDTAERPLIDQDAVTKLAIERWYSSEKFW